MFLVISYNSPPENRETAYRCKHILFSDTSTVFQEGILTVAPPNVIFLIFRGVFCADAGLHVSWLDVERPDPMGRDERAVADPRGGRPPLPY